MKETLGIFIVPTGIGASIGGFAGDASRYAAKFSKKAKLIVNPNVVNAGGFSGINGNMLYVEGYVLDEFVKGNINDLHPGVQANIILDGKNIGILGKIHPNITKDDIYIFEFDLDSLIGKSGKLKYKEAYKYPSISKDMAFIINKKIEAGDIIKTIKKVSDNTLKEVNVFDIYMGNNIDNDKKSIAFNLLYNGDNRTLTDEEVKVLFNKAIKEVENKYNAVLRNN